MECYIWSVLSAPARFISGGKTLSALTQAASAANTAAPVPGMTQPGANSDDILACVLAALDENKAEDVTQIDLRGKSSICDHMVICSGRSSRQVAAISEKLSEKLKSDLSVLTRREGKQTGDWVLIDAGDVIVHLFRPEVREFYQLEKMWLTAPESGMAGRTAGSA